MARENVSRRDFPAWYEKFGRGQRTTLVLVAAGCVLVVALGLWLYALGLALGFFMGYSFSRSRHHAEMAKVLFQFADFLERSTGGDGR